MGEARPFFCYAVAMLESRILMMFRGNPVLHTFSKRGSSQRHLSNLQPQTHESCFVRLKVGCQSPHCMTSVQIGCIPRGPSDTTDPLRRTLRRYFKGNPYGAVALSGDALGISLKESRASLIRLQVSSPQNLRNSQTLHPLTSRSIF